MVILLKLGFGLLVRFPGSGRICVRLFWVLSIAVLSHYSSLGWNGMTAAITLALKPV
jgi:hypothetical protein